MTAARRMRIHRNTNIKTVTNMKIKKLSSLLLAGLFVLGACSESPESVPDADDDDSAGLDYTAANAESWGNYMVRVAALLRKDAADLHAAWQTSYQGGAPFAEIFKRHTGGGYTSAMSCVEQIIEGCADIANEVGTSKIGDPYNLYRSGDRKSALYAVESWYSWHSRDDYANNILSIRNAYFGSRDGQVAEASISALVAEADPALDERVKAAVATAHTKILDISQPFRNNIASAATVEAMNACADLEAVLTGALKNAVAALSSRETALQAVVENFVDNVVLPTYAELSARNAALYQAVAAFKAAPSDAAFAEAARAWLEAREPWECSEAFLFGPVDALGLDPNMDSWPLDQDAIVQLLNSGNYDGLDWTDGDAEDAVEAVQSVRGFHTLEFLLFKDGKPRKSGL